MSAAEPPDGPSGCRFLNPVTRDFEIDDDTGQQKQMPSARQMVLLAVLTSKGSARGLPNFGIKVPPVITASFQTEMTNAVREALLHITEKRKIVRLNKVTAEKVGFGRVRTTISFTDLRTGRDDAVRF